MAVQVSPNVPALPATTAIQDPATRQFANAVADALRANSSKDNSVRTLIEALETVAEASGPGLSGGGTSSIVSEIYKSRLYNALREPIAKLVVNDGLGSAEAIEVIKENNTAIVNALNTMWSTVGASGAFSEDGRNIVSNWTTAQAEKWSQIEAEVLSAGGKTIRAALREEAEVRADLAGDVYASYTLRVDVNGNVAGFGITADENSSDFIILANRFAVISPGAAPRTPFYVENGVVYLDAAIIGNIIKSNNYVPGESGWIINRSGFAEFQGAEFRGNIKGSVIEGSTIIASSIVRYTYAGAPWYTAFSSTTVVSDSGAWVETYRGGKDNADGIAECLSGILNIYPYNAGPSGTGNTAHFIGSTATINVDVVWDTNVVARGTEFNAYIYLTDEAGNNVETLLSYDYRYGGLNSYTSNGLRVSGLYTSYSYDDADGVTYSGTSMTGLTVTGSIVRSWTASSWAGRRFRLKVVFRTWRGSNIGMSGYVRLSAVNHRLG